MLILQKQKTGTRKWENIGEFANSEAALHFMLCTANTSHDSENCYHYRIKPNQNKRTKIRNTVIIEVRSGRAEATHIPEGISVLIVDYDEGKR